MNKTILFISLILLPLLIQGYQIPSYIPKIEDTWVPSNYSGDYIHPITGDIPSQQGQLTYFFINVSHPNATDDNNQYGTPDRPRRTIHQNQVYPAGSVVEISGGPYNQAVQGKHELYINGEGTPNNPIWIKGPSDGNVDIQVKFRIKASYIFIQDLKFNKEFFTVSLYTHQKSYVHHAVIRRCQFKGTGTLQERFTSVITICGNDQHTFHDNIIYDNEISYYGDSFSDVDPALGLTIENDYHGIKPNFYLNRTWIFKNHVHHMGGDSIQVGEAQGAPEARVNNTYIFDNDFHDNLENAIDIKKSNFTIIAENKLYNQISHNDRGGSGCIMVVHDNSDQTWIINNEMFNSTTGSVSADNSKNQYYINNYVHDITIPDWNVDWYPSVWRGGGGLKQMTGASGAVIGNTIVRATNGIVVQSSHHVDIFNNIISERNREDGYDLIKEGSSTAQYHHNLLHSTQQTNPKVSEIIDCIDCIYQDPLISQQSPPALQDASPAIDAGADIQPFLDLYYEKFGVQLSIDHLGNDRTVKQTDIGAYEKQCDLDATSCSFPHHFNLDQCDCICHPPRDSEGNIDCPANTAYSHEYCKCVGFNHGKQCQLDSYDCSGGLAETCQNGSCVQLCQDLIDCQNPSFNYCRTTLADPIQKSCQQFQCEDNSQCNYPYICDTSNTCACDTNQHCSTAYQSVDISTCSCQCDYNKDQNPCPNPNFQWDAQSCQCTCNIPTNRYGIPQCPQGQIYDASNCSCYLPSAPQNCSQFVQVFSAANDDGNFVKFYLNGVEEQITVGDGYNYAVYDQTTFQLKEFKNFNLFVNGHNKVIQMIEFIQNIQAGDYVFLGIKVDGSYKSSGGVYSALETLGLSQNFKFGWASSFAFIGQKGLQPGQATQLQKQAKFGPAYVEKCLLQN